MKTKLKPRADRRRSKAAKRGWVTRKRKERVRAASPRQFWENEIVVQYLLMEQKRQAAALRTP